MSVYIKILLLISVYFSQTYSVEKKMLGSLFQELDSMANHQSLAKEQWINYIKKVDGLCDKKQEYCDYYYKIQSSLVMFESDSHKDQGQCGRAKQNVESHFRGTLNKQKKQVLSIIEKLCPRDNDIIK